MKYIFSIWKVQIIAHDNSLGDSMGNIQFNSIQNIERYRRMGEKDIEEEENKRRDRDGERRSAR